MGMTSDSLTLASHSLKYIKTWGWGNNCKFTKDVKMFIDKIKGKYTLPTLSCAERSSQAVSWTEVAAGDWVL